MKNILTALCFFLMAYSLISCTKGGDQAGFNGNTYTLSSIASSKLLIPPFDTTSTGKLSGLYDEQANILTYTIVWNDLWKDSIYDATQKKNIVTTPTQRDVLSYIKFYSSSSVTDSGTVVRSMALTNANRSSSLTFSLAGSKALTATEKADLYANKWYIVLATKKYPKGIIRGQLITIKK